jgi:hypothetical protein
MSRRHATPVVPAAALAALAICLGLGLTACAPRGYDPALATEPYPVERHVAGSVDIELFRDGPNARIVNATVNGYRNVRLWLNQRWVREIPDLPAGAIIELSLDGFRDENGEKFVAGGFFRTERSTPIVLAQLEQVDAPDAELVGLRVVGPVFDAQ